MSESAGVSEATSAEQAVWQGHPSHVLYLGTYILCALFCWLIVPIFIALYIWLMLRSRVYELTTQRLFYTTGIFSKHREEWEIYRIKDMRVEEPFKLRLFGRGNIVLETSDRSTPVFTMEGIPEPRQLADRIRLMVEERRKARGVREVDVE